ncbi:MAG TPA: hypothetical protein P5514_05230 [Bacteroidales bacterium]|nr:hypothetical protein [Bacteroidales bacterium]HPE54807.1 hypothetical protein [Bacteroidales bacterium]HRX96326.1 hypothetical protein [Bacteroidales bacterium]
MKYVLSFLVLAMFVMGCDKADEPAPTDSKTPSEGLKATVETNVVNVSIDNLSVIIGNNAGNAGGYMEISGTAASGETFKLRFVKDGFMSRDVLTTGAVENFILEYQNAGNSWLNENYTLVGIHVGNPDGVPDGQFTITGMNDNNIWGTFSFVGYSYTDTSTTNVTEGTFNARFEN